MYKAVLFSADGDWVVDYSGTKTIEEVQERLADQGSRWYFYPFHAVITDRGLLTRDTQRLVDVAWPFEMLAGKTIATMSKVIADTPEAVLADILWS
jgi:hypothetical protein